MLRYIFLLVVSLATVGFLNQLVLAQEPFDLWFTEKKESPLPSEVMATDLGAVNQVRAGIFEKEKFPDQESLSTVGLVQGSQGVEFDLVEAPQLVDDLYQQFFKSDLKLATWSNVSPVGKTSGPSSEVGGALSLLASASGSEKETVGIDSVLEDQVEVKAVSDLESDLIPELVIEPAVEYLNYPLGSVVFSEIAWMGRPDSSTDEWLELVSHHPEEVDLSGWLLFSVDGRLEIDLAGKILAGQYFILERTDDQTLPAYQADQIYKGSLKNSGLDLKLVDAHGNLIDQLDFSSGWPGGDLKTKQTLAKVDYFWGTHALVGQAGWSPGEANTLVELEVAPPVGAVQDSDLEGGQLSDQSLNKVVDSNNDQLKADHELIDLEFEEVEVDLRDKAGLAADYKTDSLAKDSGEVGSDLGEEQVPESPVQVFANNRGLVFSEIAWMGTFVSANDEWLELVNLSDQPLDLSGWFFRSLDDQIKVFLEGVVLPGQYLILERTDDSTLPSLRADFIYSGSLVNRGVGLELVNGAGVVVDQVLAVDGWLAGVSKTKQTMARDLSKFPGWLDKLAELTWHHHQVVALEEALVNGSPGLVNQVLTTDLSKNEAAPPADPCLSGG